MTGRTSLVEQKRIQWAMEREEMARLGGSWGLLKQGGNTRSTIRTYPAASRISFPETKDKQARCQPLRAGGHYGSTISLKSLATETSGNGTTNLKCLDYNGGSLINLHDRTEMSQIRRRSPSLPPIYNKDQQQYLCQDQQRGIGIDGLRFHSQRQHENHYRLYDQHEHTKESHYGLQAEEREGETSGYASDSVEVPLPATERLLPGCNQQGIEMTEKTWQNPYYTTPESSLPPSRRLSDGRMGELNRPRWGSVWGQDTTRGDPPPPSWLSRLGQSSQVLVINHDSASSPDSSRTGSTGSDTNKTHLRGQNIPVDADILQERESRRQKALELQIAIKQQLEENDRRRKEEKERRLREERLEEERIQRERECERERYEEEKKRLREKEAAKLKQAEVMREVLEAAERLAKEEKKVRRKRDETEEESIIYSPKGCKSKSSVNQSNTQREEGNTMTRKLTKNQENSNVTNVNWDANNAEEIASAKEDEQKGKVETSEKTVNHSKDIKPIQVPISKDVAIVLSGRLEDSEIFNKTNLQLVNFIVTPSPRKFDECTNNLSVGLNALMRNIGSSMSPRNSARTSTIVENRLLTPSKYRSANGRDFGIQTDIENDLQDLQDKLEESTVKDGTLKERKDTTNANRRDVEKSTNVGPAEEISLKTGSRSKSQPRTSLESRPRWNANRPGTRYRTQSEKDPHYQRRLRMKMRQVESSDERSRSPSPDRRKLTSNKMKPRNVGRRKVKLDSYDADLSMDSLNSIVPLRIDKNGRVNLEDTKCERIRRNPTESKSVDENHDANKSNDNSNIWCGQEILSKLSSLRNGLLMKKIEWDTERCLVSPAASEIF